MSTPVAGSPDAGVGSDSPYACPVTGAPLAAGGDALVAAGGGPSYPVRGGIPQFLRFGPVESEATRAELDRLNALAASEGWRAALDAVYGAGSGMVRYVTDPVRVGFLDLVAPGPDEAVLEVGSGLGQITESLGRRAGRVWALEVVPGQAEFTALRCRQQGLTNVSVACGGDDCRLPYAGGVFDAVVLNLVLEWCSTRSPGEPLVAGQRRLLAEAFRVLKPSGRVFVATKNRFGLRYLRGGRDEHAHGLPFGHALPGWLMRLALRARGESGPSGAIHSHGGLRRLIEGAGFVRPRSYWAAPEMRFPTDFVPTDAASVREARRRPGFPQGQGRGDRLLMPLVPAPLVKFFTPGLLFLAEKPAPPA